MLCIWSSSAFRPVTIPGRCRSTTIIPDAAAPLKATWFPGDLTIPMITRRRHWHLEEGLLLEDSRFGPWIEVENVKEGAQPLYAAPQPSAKALTDEQIIALADRGEQPVRLEHDLETADGVLRDGCRRAGCHVQPLHARGHAVQRGDRSEGGRRRPDPCSTNSIFPLSLIRLKGT